MLERNRGARRDRTRNKMAHAKRALHRHLEGHQNDPKFSRWWYCAPTPHEQCKRKERFYLRNQGRDYPRDHHCLDCFGWGGLCEWCHGGAIRNQRRLHDSLDADFKAWKFSERNDE